MKALDSKKASQQLAGNIQLARLRVTLAESNLKSAKQQARMARRRHKEAKRSARCAKKAAKLAKQELADAKLSLAQAEAKPDSSRPITTRTRRPVGPPRKKARRASPPSQTSLKPASPPSGATKSRPRAKPKANRLRRSIAVARAIPRPVATPLTGGDELHLVQRRTNNAAAAVRSQGQAK